MYLAGQIVKDRFRLESQLGRTLQSGVWLAEDCITNSYVALKIDRAAGGIKSDDERKLLDVLERCIVLSKLKDMNNPNIIRVFEVYCDDYVIIFSMEYLTGMTLRERSIIGRVPVFDTVRLTVTLCESIRCLHQVGIVHRDIKPGNIMLLNGQVKLFDFNIAIIKGSANSFSNSRTLSYSAPEQFAEGMENDFRTDIYSLGAMAYEMLTGRLPFASDQEKLSGITPIKPSLLNTCVPHELDSIVLKCLRKNQDQRYQNIDLLREALGQIDVVDLQKKITEGKLEKVVDRTSFVGEFVSLTRNPALLQKASSLAEEGSRFIKERKYESAIPLLEEADNCLDALAEQGQSVLKTSFLTNWRVLILYLIGIVAFIYARLRATADFRHAILSLDIPCFLVLECALFDWVYFKSISLLDFLKKARHQKIAVALLGCFVVALLCIVNPLLGRYGFVFRNVASLDLANPFLNYFVNAIVVLACECVFLDLASYKLAPLIWAQIYPRRRKSVLISIGLLGTISLAYMLFPRPAFAISSLLLFSARVLVTLFAEAVLVFLFVAYIVCYSFIYQKLSNRSGS